MKVLDLRVNFPSTPITFSTLRRLNYYLIISVHDLDFNNETVHQKRKNFRIVIITSYFIITYFYLVETLYGNKVKK